MVASYPLVSACEVNVEQKPWTRVSSPSAAASSSTGAKQQSQPHRHGFNLTAPAVRLAHALARRGAATRVSGGFRDLTVLKTTQV